MKALIVGAGSIGSRHLRNLKQLGIDLLGVADPEPARREAAGRAGATATFADLHGGLDWQPDIVLITSPSHLHVEQALAAARHGCHLFIEKPLSHSADGLLQLAEEVQQRDLISLVGCNMRFHPGPAKVKELLEQQRIGRILFAQVHAGSYLPGWRPAQDYRQSYSAQARMGGGCILDCIHEIDLTRWYLGGVSEVFCVADHLSSLEMDVEDVALLVCRHAAGQLSEIHLDYVQRTYERGCRIAGEGGSIFWDFREGVVRCYVAATETWMTFPQPADWQVNDIYLAQMGHFLECVERRQPTTLPIAEAVRVMAVALAARRSAACGRFVSTTEVLQ